MVHSVSEVLVQYDFPLTSLIDGNIGVIKRLVFWNSACTIMCGSEPLSQYDGRID